MGVGVDVGVWVCINVHCRRKRVRNGGRVAGGRDGGGGGGRLVIDNESIVVIAFRHQYGTCLGFRV